MFKKFLRLIKKNEEKEDILSKEEIVNIEQIEASETDLVDCDVAISIEEEVVEAIKSQEKEQDKDLDDLLEGMIKREKTIKSIDLYTQEEKIFKTHKECSKTLNVPLGYIKENLKYGYTDYFGGAIKYLSKELQLLDVDSDSFDYLDNNKNPMELFITLNNRIFTAEVSENKREEILSSDKIEPINMHYRFECIDKEYDDYFRKYKSIIKRGGKKKIELVNKKGEVIEIFKSIDDCAIYFDKDRSEIVNMLKYGQTKIGRYEIRYSLRNI